MQLNNEENRFHINTTNVTRFPRLLFSSTQIKSALMKRVHSSFFGIFRVFRCSLEGKEPTANQSSQSSNYKESSGVFGPADEAVSRK
jgi:hypothetical protein